jgi:hypothetical protein
MTVVHGQPDMYDYLVEYCGASEAEANHTGLTPLVLAAQLGKTDMFEHIYERRRKAFYTFGKVREGVCVGGRGICLERMDWGGWQKWGWWWWFYRPLPPPGFRCFGPQDTHYQT